MGLLDFIRRLRRPARPAAEAERLACETLHRLLPLLRGKASDRKLRLFGAACCRRIWHRLPQGPQDAGRFPGRAERPPTLTELSSGAVERAEAALGLFDFNREAVELAERFADGLASRQELDGAIPVFSQYGLRNEPLDGDHAFQAWQVLLPDAYAAAAMAAWAAARGSDRAQAIEEKAQAALLRDIVDNPFRPPLIIDPAVLARHGAAARRLAEAIYAARRFEDLPVLADLLEEAGCTDAALLGHLRGPGPHVVSCHALDAVLDRW